MAGRSDSAEALLNSSAALLAQMHAKTVLRIADRADERDDDAQIKLIDSACKAGRNLGLLLALGRKLIAEFEALEAAAATPASEADQETEMDDDIDRTPERVAELRAEIERRLEAFRKSREFKRLAGVEPAAADPAELGGLAATGGPSAASG